MKSDVRLIAATNQPLSAQVARGVFREDLYYRLNVVRIVLPSLAERREDIPLLAHHFIEQLNAKQGKRIEGMSEEALARLMRYKFPGNVRELQNVLEHAVVLCRTNRIEVSCLPAELVDESSAGVASQQDLAGAPLMDAEAGAILETLRRNDGHRGRTAMALGISESTPIGENIIRLQPEDQLLLFTDGISEAFDKRLEPFGEERLSQCLKRHRDHSPSDLIDRVIKEVHAFSGSSDQSDDMTLMVVRRMSSPTQLP